MIRSRKPTSRGRRGRRRRRPQDGYNLVVLAVMITVMNVMVAKALPTWSNVIQREKEEELIFRGLQYAEAIRVFRQRFNRTPVRLKELLEQKPRSIRRLWNNPMAEEARGKPAQGIGWGLVYQGQPVLQQGEGQPGPDGRGDQPARSGRPGRDGRPFPGSSSGSGEEEQAVGPIIGVYSKVGSESVKVFCDSESIPQWRFVELMVAIQSFVPQSGQQPLGRGQQGGGGQNAQAQQNRNLQNQLRAGGQVNQANPLGQLDPNLIPSFNAGDIGRPWPPNVAGEGTAPLALGCAAATGQASPQLPPGQQRPGQQPPGQPSQGQPPQQLGGGKG
jgi:type II secretory pathway pseudopilin PulG